MNWTIEIEHRAEDDLENVFVVDHTGQRELIGIIELDEGSQMVRLEHGDGVYMFDSRRRAIGFLMMMN
jgi:hypothetical protein